MDFLLKNYASKCYKLKLSHELSLKYYDHRNNIINSINIGVVAFIAISNNVTVTIEKDNPFIGILYSIGLYISVLVSSLQKFLQYERRKETHRIASVRYNNLYNAVLMYLIIEEDKELSKPEFIRWVNSEYDILYNDSPDIPKSVMEKVENIDNDKVLSRLKEIKDDMNCKREQMKDNSSKKENTDLMMIPIEELETKTNDLTEEEKRDFSDMYDKAIMFQMKRLVSSYDN